MSVQFNLVTLLCKHVKDSSVAYLSSNVYNIRLTHFAAQMILPIATFLYSVVAHLSHLCILLKPFDKFKYHLAGILEGPI